MSVVWIAVVALAVPPVEGSHLTAVSSPPAVAEREPLVPPRTGRELRDTVRAAFARWAKPTDKEADLAAREFIALYRELQADDKLAFTQREPLQRKIRTRLSALQQQIKKRIAIQKRLSKANRPESVGTAAGRHHVLAQLGGGFGGPGFGGGMMRGGPLGGFGTANQDNGEQLVELIQQTIAPSSWDVNGGAGSIYYWRPGMALVIRNRGEVHNRIGGLLEQLNRLGR